MPPKDKILKWERVGGDHPSSPFGPNGSEGLESSKIVFRQWFDESLLQFFFVSALKTDSHNYAIKYEL